MPFRRYPSISDVPIRVEELPTHGSIPITFNSRHYPQLTEAPVRVEDLRAYGTATTGATLFRLPLLGAG